MGTLHGGVYCACGRRRHGLRLRRHPSPRARASPPSNSRSTSCGRCGRVTLTAEGPRVVKAGRTVGLVECDVLDDKERLVARASSTCMTLRGEQAEPAGSRHERRWRSRSPASARRRADPWPPARASCSTGPVAPTLLPAGHPEHVVAWGPGARQHGRRPVRRLAARAGDALAGVSLVFPLWMLMVTMSAGGYGGGVAFGGSAGARGRAAGGRQRAGRPEGVVADDGGAGGRSSRWCHWCSARPSTPRWAAPARCWRSR